MMSTVSASTFEKCYSGIDLPQSKENINTLAGIRHLELHKWHIFHVVRQAASITSILMFFD